MALLITTSCACGTAGYDITIVNRTDQVAVVYLRVPNLPPDAQVARGVRLQPGDRFVDHWLVPTGPSDNRRAVVSTTNERGDVTYCQAFSWDDLKRRGFGLELSKGPIDC